MAHLDLAAEARKKEPKPTQKGVESESEHSEADAEKKPAISIADIGNAGRDAEDDTIVEPDTSKTMPVAPLQDHVAALRTAFQKRNTRSNPDEQKAERYPEALERLGQNLRRCRNVFRLRPFFERGCGRRRFSARRES